jgi:hypothetical protein
MPDIQDEAGWINFANNLVEFCLNRHKINSESEPLLRSSADFDKYLEPIFKSASTFCRGRRLFVTTDDQVGLGHESVEKNDCIIALFGGAFPCILRPASERLYMLKNSEYWGKHTIERVGHRFVGLAYVSGIMDGELVEAFEGAGIDPTTFAIW